MPTASYTQNSFLGGEFSQWSQGQFDKPIYKTALSKLFNLWPSDEGAVTRRPGTRFLGVSRRGKAGRLLAYDFTEATPYNLEFTDNFLRMWNNTNLVSTNDSQTVVSVSSDDPAVFTLAQTVTWQDGGTVYFGFTSPTAAVVGSALLGRQFTLAMLTSTQFTVADAITGEAIGVADGVAGLTPVVLHVLEIPTQYSVATNDWHSLRFVQGYNVGVLLHASLRPQALTVLAQPTDDTFATFSFGAAPFVDGPYLDPPPLATASPNVQAAVFQLVVGYQIWSATTFYAVGTVASYAGSDYVSLINNNIGTTPSAFPDAWSALPPGSMVNSGRGFLSTDVGRLIRLFSEPLEWDSTRGYNAGESVKYAGSYFTSLVGSNMNNQPDISLTDWVINPSGAIWTWGTIIVVSAQNSVTVQLQGAPLLYPTPISVWRLGAWSDTTGWPTCGVYQEGRFWYSGAIPNRVDSSQPNAPFNMAPTGQDGTVADSNAISYTFNATEQNPIFWGVSDHEGIIWGTQEGEFLLTSGTAGTPMTPSNIQAHLQTKYGSSNVLAVRTGLTICFVKRYARRIMEYLADVFSNRFVGNDLTKNARHLGSRGIEEIDYQEELIPTVWGRCTDGTLIGSTYRRNSLFSSQDAEFNGWHQHALGSGRLIESIAVGPSVGGTLDALFLISNDPSTNVRYVEQMTTPIDETAPITQAWYLDTAVTPKAALANVSFETENPQWLGDVNAGVRQRQFTVQGGGMLPIPLNTASGSVDSVIIGGYIEAGSPISSATVQVATYDVTGDTPIELTRTSSASFSCGSGGEADSTWDLSPDGRHIAIGLFSNDTPTHQFMVYDTVAQVFGAVFGISLTLTLDHQKVMWVDTNHFVIVSISGGVLGLNAFETSGTTITDKGFTGVWGVGSSTTRLPLSYAQFTRTSSGLMHYVTNIAIPYFTALFAAEITWGSGALIAGTPYTVASGLAPWSGSGSGNGHASFVNTALGEFTLCFGTLAKVQLMSFVPGPTSAIITRPFQTLDTAFGNSTTQFPMFYTDRIVMFQGGTSENNYRLSDILLGPSSFTLGAVGVIISDAPPHFVDISGLPIDNQRFLSWNGGSSNPSNTNQLAIVLRFPRSPTRTPTSISFYTLEAYNGKKVSVFAAGIYCGEYTVEDGKVDIKYGSVDPVTGWVFNEEAFKILQPMSADFTDISVPIVYSGTTYNIPCIVGHKYKSQGQLLRPQSQQDTGARNGPGFGKKRRTSMYTMHAVNSLGVTVGTNFNTMYPVPFNKIDAGGSPLPYLSMFSGVIRETLSDTPSYDSMLAWEINGPYPATMIALGGFIEVVDI